MTITSTNWLHGNAHIVLIKRLLWVYLLFMLCRILFYAFNTVFFPGITPSGAFRLFVGGLRFDTVAIFYTNVLYILLMLVPFTFKYGKGYQRALDVLYVFTNAIALLANCSDFIYYRFTIKRATWSILTEFSHQDNLPQVFGGFLISYWYVLVIWLLMVYSLIRVSRKVRLGKRPEVGIWKFVAAHSILMGISVVLFVAGVRGGFLHSTRPITLSNAGEYVNKPKEMFIALNTPFCIYKTIQRDDYERATYYSNNEALRAIYDPIHPASTGDTLFQPKNVVVLIWESFGKEMVGAYNQDLENGSYKGYTPFVDSLMGHSRVFWHSFANGAKSIEAIPSVLTSIPGIKEPFITTRYTDNEIPSLPKMLEEKGYHTSFFHGAPNGSMGFQAFVNLIGVQHYFGKSEYGNDADYDGIWGIWDEEFLQFWAKKMNEFPQPFQSTLFTVSSHDPFNIPTRYKDKFPKGPLPIYETMGYTDQALKKFFEVAKTMPWYRNTLFVLTADHAATFAHYPRYQTSVGNFSVPVIFFAPADSTMRGIDRQTLVQQIDILPSVLSYLHYDKPYFSFGKNVFSPPALNFAVNYDGVYQWFNGTYVLQFDGQKTVGLYNYRQDQLLKKNLRGTNLEVQKPMEAQIKAFIQQYNNRMLDDKLVP
ncbi:LTA synthase family protein [Dyadobacter tibetensis]|uniref:LTA synthase family protein n=1 Tax=Dyadobacter tibetensis TaxID=1211851 RepID=UPI00046F3BE4|nr:alkaline phosphatase family protein [Dyadobacter tibetensis]